MLTITSYTYEPTQKWITKNIWLIKIDQTSQSHLTQYGHNGVSYGGEIS